MPLAADRERFYNRRKVKQKPKPQRVNQYRQHNADKRRCSSFGCISVTRSLPLSRVAVSRFCDQGADQLRICVGINTPRTVYEYDSRQTSRASLAEP